MPASKAAAGKIVAASKAALKETSKAAAAATTPKGPKLHPVSPTLRHFLGGVTEITRTDTIKQVWDYIRDAELQDPADRKQVICDEKLKTILGGKDRVDFLEISGLLSAHFPKKPVKKP